MQLVPRTTLTRARPVLSANVPASTNVPASRVLACPLRNNNSPVLALFIMTKDRRGYVRLLANAYAEVKLPANVKVYVVDDASTEYTREDLRTWFPRVRCALLAELAACAPTRAYGFVKRCSQRTPLPGLPLWLRGSCKRAALMVFQHVCLRTTRMRAHAHAIRAWQCRQLSSQQTMGKGRWTRQPGREKLSRKHLHTWYMRKKRKTLMLRSSSIQMLYCKCSHLVV